METTHNITIKLKHGIVVEFESCQIECDRSSILSYSRIDNAIGQLLSDIGMLYIDLSTNFITFNYDVFSIESTIEKVIENNNCTQYECNCESFIVEISVEKIAD